MKILPFVEEIEKFIKNRRMGIDLNKGTWMNEMEKYYDGMKDVIDDLEKILKDKKV